MIRPCCSCKNWCRCSTRCEQEDSTGFNDWVVCLSSEYYGGNNNVGKYDRSRAGVYNSHSQSSMLILETGTKEEGKVRYRGY